MQQLIYFIQKYKFFLYFLLLESIALTITINNHAFHKSKFVSSANSLTGGLLEKTATISEYFNLKEINERVLQENTVLKNKIAKLAKLIDTTLVLEKIDSTYQQQYRYTSAKIIKNSYTNPYNYITLDKGTNDGISKEMGVINSLGIIGITDISRAKYSRAQSILNKDTKINARLKNSNYFGTLTWNGVHYNTMQLIDLPRQAPIILGDTIITGGRSTMFPEGIPIGIVAKINQGNTANNTLDITLFNDMSNLKEVYIINHLDKVEIKALEDPLHE